MDDNIEKMVKEIFGKDIKKNETSSASSASASSLSSTAASATSTAASSATSLGSIDTKVDSTSQVTLSPEKSVVEKRSFSDQDYVKQYTAFLKHILERAKNVVEAIPTSDSEGLEVTRPLSILDEAEKLLASDDVANAESSVITETTNKKESAAKEGILSAVEELLNSKEFTTSSVPITTGQNGENGPEVEENGENGDGRYRTADGQNGVNGADGDGQNGDGPNGEKSATPTATASSCGDANVCIENVNNEGITTDTTIYETVGTRKNRFIEVKRIEQQS